MANGQIILFSREAQASEDHKNWMQRQAQRSDLEMVAISVEQRAWRYKNMLTHLADLFDDTRLAERGADEEEMAVLRTLRDAFKDAYIALRPQLVKAQAAKYHADRDLIAFDEAGR